MDLEELIARRGRTRRGLKHTLGVRRLTYYNRHDRTRHVHLGAHVLVCDYLRATPEEVVAPGIPGLSAALADVAPGAVLGAMLAARRRTAGDAPEDAMASVTLDVPAVAYPAREGLRRVEEGTILPPYQLVQRYSEDPTDEIARWYGYTIHRWREAIRCGTWWSVPVAVDAAIQALDGGAVVKQDLIDAAHAAVQGRIDDTMTRRIRIMLTRRLRAAGYVCTQRAPGTWMPGATVETGRRHRVDAPSAHVPGDRR